MGHSHPRSYVVGGAMTRRKAEGDMGQAIGKLGRTVTPLIVKKVCRDCGAVIRTVEELDVHDLRCTGPIRLVFTEDGTYGEVGSE